MESSGLPTGNKIFAIDERTRARLRQINGADIIIGIPSYKSFKSIGHVIKAGELGLAKYFSRYKGVIFVSEGESAEKIRNVVKALEGKLHFGQALISKPLHKTEIVVTKYHGIPGKGTALRAIFEAAKILNVKAGCLIDSDIRSISPEWIELLIAPVILKDFGFVTPYYCRHKYDGTITNLIAYSLTRALYGRRVRQPIGGDFGFSLELAKSLLSKDVWETDIARFGIDIWMTTVAICENFKICQSFLGVKIHKEKDPVKNLGPMFKQVVGTLFSLMEIYQKKWFYIKGSRPTAIFGFESECIPRPINVDIEELIKKFKVSVPECLHVWEKILQPENLHKIQEVARMKQSYFELPDELWVKAIYDFASAYKRRTNGLSALAIIEALLPIYFAKTASFVKKIQNLSHHQAEEIINQQCTSFEKLKPYLLSRWTLEKKGG